MRWRASLAVCLACLSVFAAIPGYAAPNAERDAPAAGSASTATGATGATGATSTQDSVAATAEARRHFKLGIRLYQDTNYAGALAEFQAAYAAKPSPGSLQNVALCQKALFRYREAAETLRQLLAEHAAALSDGEKKAVTDAISELDGLVGSIVVNVEPSDAKVTIDGRALLPSELHTGVEVNVGEHTVIADESGYARLVRVVSVASGRTPSPVDMKLKPTEGFLKIVASDPRAAIAVDGVTLAFKNWKGGVEPDTDHVIQVFRDGFESYESTVNVGLGQTLEVHASLGPPVAGVPEAIASKPGAMPPPPPRRVPHGYYGFFTLGVLGLGQHPLELTSTRAGGAMGTLGVRAGYRIAVPIAAELMLDFGTLTVNKAQSDDASSGETRKYTLSALRFGPNLRLMTTGRTLRFSTVLGTGVVRHRLELDPVAGSSTLTGGSASGYDPYFLLEFGVQYSLGRFLLGAAVVTSIDGATSLNKQKVEGDRVAFGNTDTLPLFGIGLYGGYALW